MWQAIAIYTLTAISFEVKIIDVDTFVRKLSYINILVSSMFSIYLVVSSSRANWINLELFIFELTSSLDLPTNKYLGVIIPVIVCFLVAHVSAYTILMISVGITFIVNYSFFASTNYTVTAIKHLVLKSMKAVIFKIVQSERPLEILCSFRQVLAYDHRIEDKYSFSVLIGLSGGVFMMCLSLIEYWKCYGLHKFCNSFESNHPFISTFSQYYSMCQLLLLGIVSTQQLSCVSILKIFQLT